MVCDKSSDDTFSKEKVRVALLIPSLEAKGPVIFTQYLIRELKNRVDYIEVFYFKETAKIDLGVKCTKISFWDNRSFDEFDIVHTTMAVPDLYGAIHIKPSKWITSMHNYIEQDVKMQSKPMKAFVVLSLWKWALRRCSNIIVSSKAMKDYYENLLGKRNYSIIPYGISEHVYAPIDPDDLKVLEHFKESDYTIIGSVGNFIKRKGFAQLVDVLERDDRLALLIIGDGPERELVSRLCDEKGLADRVYFPGFRTDSFNYYKHIDVYAHVSFSEGFGLAMLEAMENGIPVVCSKLDIYVEYFSNSDVCYFMPGDKESLFAAFDRVLENMDQYSQAARNLYEQKFNLKAMAQSHVAYYEELLDLNR